MNLAWIFLLLTSAGTAQNRIQFDADAPCYVNSVDSEAIVSLMNRASTSWERGDANALAALMARGVVEAPPGETLSGAPEVERAISEPLSRAIFAGSRLKIVVQCFRYLEGTPQGATARGNWTISRFYGQDPDPPGNPLPAHLMPPTAGNFEAFLVNQDSAWEVTNLVVKFDSP